MALFAIGDLHLSFRSDKPMDFFGGVWENYTEKIYKYWVERVTDDDTTVIVGDISWAMSLDNALDDFAFIHSLPGKKIILKGNHDYFWTTMSKMTKFFQENRLDSIQILHNNSYICDDIAICGTRSWFHESDLSDDENKKIFSREFNRLETSLKSVDDSSKRKVAFLHYPPMYDGYRCDEILELLEKYDVRHCVYGHLHGHSHKKVIEETVGNIKFNCVSADYVEFTPLMIC